MLQTLNELCALSYSLSIHVILNYFDLFLSFYLSSFVTTLLCIQSFVVDTDCSRVVVGQSIQREKEGHTWYRDTLTISTSSINSIEQK